MLHINSVGKKRHQDINYSVFLKKTKFEKNWSSFFSRFLHKYGRTHWNNTRITIYEIELHFFKTTKLFPDNLETAWFELEQNSGASSSNTTTKPLDLNCRHASWSFVLSFCLAIDFIRVMYCALGVLLHFARVVLK